MAWQTPKTDWQAGDVPVKDDFNRIEGNVGELDTKKANQADLASHTDASAPHSGHATTSALSGHTGATTAHAATSAATVSRIMMRDAYGRAKVAAPSAADDIARLDTVTEHTNRKDNPHVVTAAQIGGSNMLTELKKVDGAGSGLDADLLDGKHASAFGLIASGSYAGDDVYETGRFITVGFTPKMVTVVSSYPDTKLRGQSISIAGTTYGFAMHDISNAVHIVRKTGHAHVAEITTNGFLVSGSFGYTLNCVGSTYFWVALG
jgi:hypothetical protein